jgi:cytochrome c
MVEARKYVKGVLVSAALLCAQLSAYAESMGLGTTATPKEIAGWDIDVSPGGTGLPPGSGTVAHGEQVYRTTCMACHGSNLQGGYGPPLKGGEGSLVTQKPLKTIGSYWPYATTVFDYIRRAMPFQAPQSLTNEEVYSVTAYLLHMNGILPENATLDASSLKAIRMPNRNGFYLDDRPDVKDKRCMQRCLTKSVRSSSS